MLTGFKSKVLVIAALLLGASDASAQLWYPSFQVPQTVEREFNAAIADAGRTTSLVFQWREGVSTRSQLSLDVGFADADYQDSDLVLLVGGQYAYDLMRSTERTPLDILFTVGAFTHLGDDATQLSIPVGTSIGHKFLLDGEMAITPYMHPRLSVDILKRDSPGNGNDDSDTSLNINFDIGASFDLNNQFGIRLSATLGDVEAIGFSVLWRPLGLRR